MVGVVNGWKVKMVSEDLGEVDFQPTTLQLRLETSERWVTQIFKLT